MVHFMAKWSHSYNLPAAFLNITPKPDMLKKNHFCTDIPAIMPKKRVSFTSTFYESLKAIIA